MELHMSRQQALQMIISLGVVVPRWQGQPTASAGSPPGESRPEESPAPES